MALSSGMCLVIIGTAISLSVNIIRGICLKRKPPKGKEAKYSKRNFIFFLVSIAGVFVATIGFYPLLFCQIKTIEKPEAILTVLSILSAGTIAGFFTFSYGKAAGSINFSSKILPNPEKFFPNLISFCFQATFYLLFTAVSYFVGKSCFSYASPYLEWVILFFIFLTLVSVIAFDYWDYIDLRK